jgi:hypothetical protein
MSIWIGNVSSEPGGAVFDYWSGQDLRLFIRGLEQSLFWRTLRSAHELVKVSPFGGDDESP